METPYALMKVIGMAETAATKMEAAAAEDSTVILRRKYWREQEALKLCRDLQTELHKASRELWLAEMAVQEAGADALPPNRLRSIEEGKE